MHTNFPKVNGKAKIAKVTHCLNIKVLQVIVKFKGFLLAVSLKPH